jgi:hypothetical protein
VSAAAHENFARRDTAEVEGVLNATEKHLSAVKDTFAPISWPRDCDEWRITIAAFKHGEGQADHSKVYRDLRFMPVDEERAVNCPDAARQKMVIPQSLGEKGYR